MNKALPLTLIGALALAACAPTATTSSGIPTTTVSSANGTVMNSPANQSGTPAAAITTPGNAGPSGATATTAVSPPVTSASATATTQTGTNQVAPTTTTTLGGAAATERVFVLTRQAAAPPTLDPSSSMTRVASPTTVQTRATLRGLVANTFYVAHYHLQGTANTNPCLSNGAALMSSKMVGRTDANGVLNLTGTVPLADVREATYFNVHTAVNAAGDPADGGVACSAIQTPQ